MCAIPVGITVIEMYFPCIRLIENWIQNSVLTDLSGDLAITPLRCYTILILKVDLSSACIRIQPRRMMVSSIFIDTLLVGYLYF